MARLHEYQGKALLGEHGIPVPRGRAASSAAAAREITENLGVPVVLKAQAWVTGRKAKGGVVFADDPDQAAAHAEKLLSMSFGNFPVTEVLVEEAIDIRDELFISLSIDDAAQAPVLLLDCQGGSGIEDRASSVARLPVDVIEGLAPELIQQELSKSSIDVSFHEAIVDAIVKAVDLAREIEARSLEINPLVTTGDDRVMAADCRIAIDDYAVFRQESLGIEIARELDHPATELERIAYNIEQADHRGTFYFAQLSTDAPPLTSRDRKGAMGDGGASAQSTGSSSRGLIGFHGAGGGGSMMSMDAVSNLPGGGFALANCCDTSGNPSAAKVYRAARVILSQPGLVGYFGSGSGVASQEQFWSAYGLAKAFIEMNMAIPSVIRLGGNSEDRAVEILQNACADLPATIEGYKKDDTPAFCAERFATLVEEAGGKAPAMIRSIPEYVGTPDACHFAIEGGNVWIDHASCDEKISNYIIEKSEGLLKANENGKPILAVSAEEIAKKDSELIALEIESRRQGTPILFVDLTIPDLDDPSPFS